MRNMNSVTVKRVVRRDDSTFGVLVYDNQPRFVTLEPPWKNNQHNISCIPEGIYHAVKFNSPHFGRTWQLIDVPNRTSIEFHFGNYVKNTEGCILLGTSYNPNHLMIMDSQRALQNFIKATENWTELEVRVE